MQVMSEQQFLVAKNSLNKLRREIYAWLKTQPLEKVKEICTIKIKSNVEILQQIMERAENKMTPQDIVKKGYGFPTNHKIYRRENYKHKFYSGNREGMKKVDQLARNLYENLTISRVQPNLVSIRTRFLPSLQHCMDQLSKNQLFLYNSFSTIEYLLIQIGDQNYQPIWFNIRQVHSIAQFVVSMLQSEIKKAYMQHKQKMKSNVSNDPDELLTFYRFVKQRYQQPENIKKVLQKVILENVVKDHSPSNQEKKFFIKKCIDRINQQQDQQEYLIEYSWFDQNSQNENFMIFQKVAEALFPQFLQWKENKQLQRQLEKQEKERKKKIEKRKRQREKRVREKMNGIQKKEDKQTQENKEDEDMKEQSKQEKIENNLEIKQQGINQTLNQTPQEQSTVVEEQILQRQQQDKTESKVLKQAIKGKTIKKSKKEKGKTQQMREQTGQEYLKDEVNKQTNANKKIIRQRINEYYQCFCQQLSEVASTYDKYRRVVFSVVQNFLNDDFFGRNADNINELEQLNWKLEVYGSASAGFSLRHSDIDIVLLTDIQRISLHQIFEKLKLKEWAIDCKFIQAQIPIITFQVNLQYSHVAFAKLTDKQFKKIQEELFSVDLTLSAFAEPHSGIQNTKHLKQIFEVYPSIRYVCLLLKQYLRVKCLNKPYKGGINSYVLIMLVHAILSRKGIIQIGSDQYRKIKEICQFMEQEFLPFETVISCKKNEEKKPDKCLHLNIINSKTDQLLKTSAFNIQIIVMELKKFREFQQKIEKELQTMNMIEKRKMKHFFLEKLRNFFQADLN